MSSLPDVVVRVGHPTEELRYTLRAIEANLPHRNLWTAGAPTPWLEGIPHINVPQQAPKHVHAYLVLRAILDCDDLTPEVIISDDDMYAMRPIGTLRPHHRGPLGSVKPPSASAARGIAATLGIVGPDAPCRDTHTPSLVNRARLTAQLDAINMPIERKARLLWRTIHAHGEPIQIADAKVRRAADMPPDTDWLSTNADSWRGLAGELVRNTFPKTARWEIETPPHP